MGHNSNFDERLARYATREIVQERGIDLEELWNSFVPMVVSQRGWGKFVQQLIRASLKYGLERDVDHIEGVAQNPNSTANSEEVVKDLRMSGKPTWTSSRFVMFSEELNLDSTFWNEFWYYSVLSKSTRSMVSPKIISKS
ncbi:hypothetical protein ACOSQ4_014172 [Xanthoceras sorbifolium]